MLGGPIISGADPFAVLRAARLRDSRTAHRLRRHTSAHGFETRESTSSPCPDASCAAPVPQGVPGTDAERWRAVRARRIVEGPCILRIHSSYTRNRRCVVRTHWSRRPARSDDYSDCSESGLFLSLALRAAIGTYRHPPRHPILLIGPAIGIVVLLALPFFAGEGEKSWKRRPIAVLVILSTAVGSGHADESG